jgi:hypothetical protein
MKKLLVALALTTAVATAAPAFADVGISLRVGEPGFYGQLDIGDVYYGRPRLIYSEPVVIERRYRSSAPIYLVVPPGHARRWKDYCGRYNACGRPVYFVRDDWYRNVYAPRYRERHFHDWRDHDRHDHGRNDPHDRHNWRDDRRDDRHDHRH